jgi:hypothetical protein
VSDSPSRSRDTRAALAYHEATKHSERSVRLSAHFLDWSNQPLPFFRDLEPIRLPAFSALDTPALFAIADPTPTRSESPELAALARVLERFGNRGCRAAQLEGGSPEGASISPPMLSASARSASPFSTTRSRTSSRAHAAGKSVMFLTALGPSRPRRARPRALMDRRKLA